MSADAAVPALREIPDLTIRLEEPLARHSVYRAGGPAEVYVVAETEDAVAATAKACHAVKVKLHGVEGLGFLVRQSGAPGVWLRPGVVAEGLARLDELELDVGARFPAAALAGWCMRNGLGGFEHLGGMAGTVAEAFRSGELEDHLISARVVRGARLAKVGPRKVLGHHILLRLHLKGRGEPASRVRKNTRRAMQRRRGRGPGLPGRLMADPKKNESAAELMAESGLCGVRVRDARLGVFEPNSVVNLGGATPSDIKLLATMARDRVKLNTGVELSLEIKPTGGRR